MCTYARISLARFPSRSIFRTGPLSLAVRSPLSSLPRARSAPVLRHPSRSYPLVSLVPSRSSVSTPARSLSPRFSLDSFPLFLAPTLSRALAIPLSPSACHRSGPVAFFFRRTSFFPQHAPGPSSDFYNLLLVARHTPPTVASSAAAAVCPARPTRKNRKIEENKSDRRATARRASRGVYSGGGGGSGNGNGGGSYGGGR